MMSYNNGNYNSNNPYQNYYYQQQQQQQQQYYYAMYPGLANQPVLTNNPQQLQPQLNTSINSIPLGSGLLPSPSGISGTSSLASNLIPSYTSVQAPSVALTNTYGYNQNDASYSQQMYSSDHMNQAASQMQYQRYQGQVIDYDNGRRRGILGDGPSGPQVLPTAVPPPPSQPPPPAYPPPPPPSQPAPPPNNQSSQCDSIEMLRREGVELKMNNNKMNEKSNINAFFCEFCEAYCGDIEAALRHVKFDSHQHAKRGGRLSGIDAKFVTHTHRIAEFEVALARKRQLLLLSNVMKQDYYDEGIRLKDGIGQSAYICEKCGAKISSLEEVASHLENHSNLEDELKVCSKPIIGLDFLTEHLDRNNPNTPRIYYCSICSCQSSVKQVINHLTSFHHRLNFIKRIHPSEGIRLAVESQETLLEISKRALEMETLVGRGQFRVTYDPPPQTKPHIQLALTKSKADHEKSPLEKLFDVKLTSEEDANRVVQIITQITKSVMEYKIANCDPEKRQMLERQIRQTTQ